MISCEVRCDCGRSGFWVDEGTVSSTCVFCKSRYAYVYVEGLLLQPIKIPVKFQELIKAKDIKGLKKYIRDNKVVKTSILNRKNEKSLIEELLKLKF